MSKESSRTTFITQRNCIIRFSPTGVGEIKVPRFFLSHTCFFPRTPHFNVAHLDGVFWTIEKKVPFCTNACRVRRNIEMRGAGSFAIDMRSTCRGTFISPTPESKKVTLNGFASNDVVSPPPSCYQTFVEYRRRFMLPDRFA